MENIGSRINSRIVLLARFVQIVQNIFHVLKSTQGDNRMRKTVELIRAPKKRFSLPCYDKSICQREGFCKEVDKIVREHVYTPMGVVKSRSTIHRQPCDKDCERRINLDDVPIKVCIKAKCEFLQDSYCQKYVQESLVKRPRTAMVFPKGISTATGEVRGFYGKKRLDGKGFVK